MGVLIATMCAAVISHRTGVHFAWFMGFFAGTVVVCVSALLPYKAAIQELRSKIQNPEAEKAQTA
jgi:hypothetical protein